MSLPNNFVVVVVVVVCITVVLNFVSDNTTTYKVQDIKHKKSNSYSTAFSYYFVPPTSIIPGQS